MSVLDSGGGQVTGPRLQHVVLYCSMVLRTLTEKLSHVRPDANISSLRKDTEYVSVFTH